MNEKEIEYNVKKYILKMYPTLFDNLLFFFIQIKLSLLVHFQLLLIQLLGIQIYMRTLMQLKIHHF